MSFQAEKELAAIKGIAAGGLLAIIELTAGFLTFSLGLITSALNTVLNLIAVVMAYLGVKIAGKGPDESHLYGHEKVESLAALSEFALLFAVCAWVIHDALMRLTSGFQQINMWFLAFGVNFISLALDSYSVLKLRTTGKKCDSSALEASSLHFLIDGLIAVTVIVGLAFYRFGYWYADPIAGLAIVVFILSSSKGTIREATDILLDRAPSEVIDQLKRHIVNIDGIVDCHHLRVRRSGPRIFADMHVSIDGTASLSEAHAISDSIEKRVQRLFPGADVVVHTEPMEVEEEDLVKRILVIARQIEGVEGAHNIRIRSMRKKLYIDCHLELLGKLPLKRAHRISEDFESEIRYRIENVARITTHLEPFSEKIPSKVEVPSRVSTIKEEVKAIAMGISGISSCHKVTIIGEGELFDVSLHCLTDHHVTLDEAHAISTKLEKRIRERINNVGQVTVHVEPG